MQRVRHTGQPVAAVRALHVTKSGLDLSFTTPVDEAPATALENYSVQQWNYRWSEEYGSDHYSVDNPKKVVGKRGAARRRDGDQNYKNFRRWQNGVAGNPRTPPRDVDGDQGQAQDGGRRAAAGGDLQPDQPGAVRANIGLAWFGIVLS